MERNKIPYLETNHLYKSFGHVKALTDVSIRAYSGEVLAIVGDNGAGKTTLIKILSGVQKPDSGTIRIGEDEYKGLTPRKAIDAGVSAVYQDLALGNTLDVASNIFLGNEITTAGFLKKRKMEAESRRLIDSLDIQIPDITVPVETLSGGQRQGVAVARLVLRGGRLFIFDEPTAAMGLNESAAVLKQIQKLAHEGYSVIVISHNLPQVLRVSDRLCVMRHGSVIRECLRSETSFDEIVTLIAGSKEQFSGGEV